MLELVDSMLAISHGEKQGMIASRVVKPSPPVWGLLSSTESRRGGCVVDVDFGIENIVSGMHLEIVTRIS